jgi:L-aspartate oxidase
VNRPFASRRDLEVKNMVQVARCVAEAALWRADSVGAHYRADAPKAARPSRTQHSLVLLKSEKLEVRSIKLKAKKNR